MTIKDKIRAVLWVLYALAVICGVVYLVATSAGAVDYVSISDSGKITSDPPLPVGIPCCEVDKPQMVYVGRYYITGYDTCDSCCGKSDGITASGKTATVGRTIATSKEFAFGTVLYIAGIGERTVEDRGVKDGCIDVLCDCHADCYAVTGYYYVYLIGG